MKNIDMNIFRDRLRSRCKKLKITHKILAEKADISESSIDKWISGKNYNDYIPSLNTVYKVSQVLGVSVDYLINPDMEYLTVSSKMMSEYTGLSDTAIECLREWYLDKQQSNPLHQYSNDTDTLNTILEYYANIPKENAEKHHLANSFSLFHFIGNFFNAHKFKRVQQNLVRYSIGSGKEIRFETIKVGDTITKQGTGKSEKIEHLCTPINSESHRGDDTSQLDIINTENKSEQYYVDVADIYREYCKSQIISILQKIGGIQ